jgi:hypothetical protein
VNLIEDIRHALALKKVADRLKEAARMKILLATVYALLGCVVTAIVAQFTGACPTLVANLGAIVTAGLGGFFAFVANRPKDQPGGKAILSAALAAGIAAIAAQLKIVCGAGFVEQIPTLAMAGVWVGVGVFVSTKYHRAA